MKPFASESALCDAFVAALKGDEWTPYAETAGFDLLLVRRRDGFQIGVQAKLRLTIGVINQLLESSYAWDCEKSGPDCRAVLVPDGGGGGFDKVAAYCRFTILRMRPPPPRGVRRAPFVPDLPLDDPLHGSDIWNRDWHELLPVKRCALPEYVPDVRAGVPSPVQLTDWKIRALKLAALLDDRGFVTRRDFAHLGMDHRRWIADTRWLKIENGRWVRGDRWPFFERQHPVVYEQIKADMPKWAPAVSQFDFALPPPRLPL